MDEPAHIELGHAKWINNIRTAFERNIEAQYRIFREEYQFWCEKENTEVRDIELIEFTYKPDNTVTADKVVENAKENTKTKLDSNTIMNLGTKVTNNMPRLSRFFDDIMINKNVHMPVSVFDPTWILQDSLFMKARTAKNTACSSSVVSYIGTPVLSEWRLTQSEWSTRFNLMVQYQELVYDVLDSQKDSPIAPRLRQHKEIILQIQTKGYGKWTPAMRYDIAHRRNVWENRLPDGSMADVGTLNEELAEQAKEDAKHFGDYKYTDNPYAFGSAMRNISPINGLTYPENNSWDSPNALIDTQADMLTGRNISALTNLPITIPATPAITSTSTKPYNSNYKGRHYNPYYSKNKTNINDNNNQSQYTTSSNNYGTTIRGNMNIRGGNRGGRGSFGGRTHNPNRGRPAIGVGSFDPIGGQKQGNDQRPNEAGMEGNQAGIM
ncbi:hypothetical protein DFH28DRAFT_1049209 [Melampsora americana]|nr:hypothetical protein DFH28DRAFT_1049209 [Melampsora americana]